MRQQHHAAETAGVGKMPLDRGKAEAALAAVAKALGLPSAAHAAEAALRVATVKMAAELFKLLAQKGYEPSSHVVVPFGGAGPTHAVMLAEEAKLAGVTVPTAAATFCALGAAVADVRRDFVRSLGKSLLLRVSERLWSNWEALERDAGQWLDDEKVAILSRRLIHSVDMQYAGQSYSLTVTVPGPVRDAKDIQGVIDAFHRAHEGIYGFREADHAVEAVTQRLSIIGEVPKVDLPELAEGTAAPAARSHRKAFHAGAWIDIAVHDRSDLGAGSTLAGPAVVEQDDTTLWLPPGWRLRADRFGLLNIDRNSDHAA
jgi:N-methylhydantoinase A